MKNYYTILQEKIGFKVVEYRQEWNRAGKNNYVPKYPLHLNFELTFGCNLRCEFCYYSIPLKEWGYKVCPNRKISFDKYCEIIKEGSDLGLYSIALNGNNEPLLKKDIDKYINYASKCNILDISLHTNGILLDEDFSYMIINSGLTGIMFSIDSYTKETYFEIRKKDEYEKIINNILNFLKIRDYYKKDFPLVRVSFMRNKINYSEENDFINFWEDKVDSIEIQIFRNLFIDHDSYSFIHNKYYFEDDLFENCYDPYRRLSIQNNGNVFPCCSTYGNEIILGNIWKNSILDIWNSEKINKIRNLVSVNSEDQPYACKKCKLSSIGNKNNI